MNHTVTFEGEAGLYRERERAWAAGFIVGQKYKVTEALRGAFHTTLTIAGKDGSWNSVLFDVPPDLPMMDTYLPKVIAQPSPNVVQSHDPNLMRILVINNSGVYRGLEAFDGKTYTSSERGSFAADLGWIAGHLLGKGFTPNEITKALAEAFERFPS